MATARKANALIRVGQASLKGGYVEVSTGDNKFLIGFLDMDKCLSGKSLVIPVYAEPEQ
jgi:hypothetical protein